MIGDNLAKMRLLLAKRAGYLDQGARIPPRPGAATVMWKHASANLARDAREAGFLQPMMYLRTAAHMGSLPPKPQPIVPGRGGLAYNASEEA